MSVGSTPTALLYFRKGKNISCPYKSEEVNGWQQRQPTVKRWKQLPSWLNSLRPAPIAGICGPLCSTTYATPPANQSSSFAGALLLVALKKTDRFMKL